ncbi:hypothetical protein AB0C96_06765 [Streptomyces sp. NPDC048506]
MTGTGAARAAEPEITDLAGVLRRAVRHAYGEARLSGGTPQWSRT